MAKKSGWYVRLGSHEWCKFMFGRSEDDSLQMIGSVCKGPQIGALAITRDNQYVQVVGDFVSPLNFKQISSAVQKAKKNECHQPRRPISFAPSSSRQSTPVVIIKRRRSFTPA